MAQRSAEPKEGKRVMSRSKSVATETRGDNPSTSGGGRQRTSESANMRRAASSSQLGTRTMPENQKTTVDSQKATAEGYAHHRSTVKEAPKSLEARKQRRAKRTGYTHPAANPSNLDLFSMPDGGLSHSAAAQLKKKACPFLHSDKSAGVPSDRIRDGKNMADRPPNTNASCYRPQQNTDPITHRPADFNEVKRSGTLAQGAAGVGSDKLTMMQGTWFKEIYPDAATRTSATNESCWLERPNVDFYMHKHKRQYPGSSAYVDAVNIKHNPGQPEQMKPEDVAKWSKMKQVRIRGGEFIYNVAGHEDLLPSSTQPFTKADRPPSASHRADNDKRYLSKMYRPQQQEATGPKKYQESYDMRFVMGEDTESALGLYGEQSMASAEMARGALAASLLAATPRPLTKGATPRSKSARGAPVPRSY